MIYNIETGELTRTVNLEENFTENYPSIIFRSISNFNYEESTETIRFQIDDNYHHTLVVINNQFEYW